MGSHANPEAPPLPKPGGDRERMYPNGLNASHKAKAFLDGIRFAYPRPRLVPALCQAVRPERVSMVEKSERRVRSRPRGSLDYARDRLFDSAPPSAVSRDKGRTVRPLVYFLFCRHEWPLGRRIRAPQGMTWKGLTNERCHRGRDRRPADCRDR